ncbi:MAG: LacI family transcriptional regulator, sucrose operon repressor [Clostridiales bacterium]|jgi:DNA-binding LacI/PurR family transcriptional regulator|nr:LacI family transcriptional regulator, sucrose operon repressor [Clostridiales bacterium]
MATIKDVARQADVSIATVSRMMNNPDVVSEKTRKKIYKTMQELNYQPNAMARALQAQKSNIIGLIVPVIDYAFFSRLTDAVEEACHEHGYKLMLCRSSYEEEREMEMVSLLQANKVDGILVCSHVGDASLYTQFNLPIVSIDREIEGIPSVKADNYNGGVLAAKGLLQAGCRHPLLLAGVVPEYMAMSQRHRGFQDECEKQGVVVTKFMIDDMIFSTKDQVALVDFLQSHPEIDGIFANGDMLAARFLLMVRTPQAQRWKRLPVVGFDGLEIAEFMQLSTIAQPIREMGECAVDLLLRKMEGKTVPERSTLAVTYVERQSTVAEKN